MAVLSDLVSDIKDDLTIAGTRYDDKIKRAVRSTLTLLRGSKLWFLETSYPITLVTGDTSELLPTDFATKVSATLISDGITYTHRNGFQWVNYEDLENNYMTTSPLQTARPDKWSISRGRIYFNTVAAADYTVNLRYVKKDVSLPVNDGDTSIWFDEGYELIRTSAIVAFKRTASGFKIEEDDLLAVKIAEEALDRQNGSINL